MKFYLPYNAISTGRVAPFIQGISTSQVFRFEGRTYRRIYFDFGLSFIYLTVGYRTVEVELNLARRIKCALALPYFLLVGIFVLAIGFPVMGLKLLSSRLLDVVDDTIDALVKPVPVTVDGFVPTLQRLLKGIFA